MAVFASERANNRVLSCTRYSYTKMEKMGLWGVVGRNTEKDSGRERRLQKMQGAKKPVRRGYGIQIPGGENGLYRGSERAKKGIKTPPEKPGVSFHGDGAITAALLDQAG